MEEFQGVLHSSLSIICWASRHNLRRKREGKGFVKDTFPFVFYFIGYFVPNFTGNFVRIGFGGRVYEYYERKQSADSGRRV